MFRRDLYLGVELDSKVKADGTIVKNIFHLKYVALV